MMKNPISLFVFLVACGLAGSAWAAVTASVSSDVVASGETLQLRLKSEGSVDGMPDLDPLKKDFDVLGSSSGSSVQLINGRISAQKQVTVLLSPKRDGKVQIPPLRWGNDTTGAIEITVGGSGETRTQDPHAARESSRVFITTSVDQKQPYVQAAVVLTVRLYANQSLYEPSLDLSANSDVLVKQLGEDVSSTEKRDGRHYQVIERKYLLFPQRSGELSLDGPVLDAQVQATDGGDPFSGMFWRGMMNATRPLRLRGKPIALNVLPRPANATAANWMPARKVTLKEAWRPETTTIRVGEPLTRHLHLGALGLTSDQLPDLDTLMPVPEGLKVYPDQSSGADNVQGDSVYGSRDQDIALIASRPGRYELPPVRVTWWNTAKNAAQEVSLPARTLEVLPAPGGVTGSGNAIGTAGVVLSSSEKSEPPPQSTPDGNVQVTVPSAVSDALPWKWISMALALLWLVTLVAWWITWKRSRAPRQKKTRGEASATSGPVVGANAFRAVKRACKSNDAPAARKHLLAWASSVWPTAAPTGLNELARRLEGAALINALRQLDRACATGEAWSGNDLARCLASVPVQPAATEKKDALPGLYSSST